MTAALEWLDLDRRATLADMSPLLQRLQRRVIVALAWLVLALAVAPAAALPMRPQTVYAAAAASLCVEASTAGRAHGARAAGAGRSTELASRGGVRAVGGQSLQRSARPIELARPPARVAPERPPCTRGDGARDERHLYLSLCRLSC